MCPPLEPGHVNNVNKETLGVMSLERKLSWITVATQPCKPIIFSSGLFLYAVDTHRDLPITVTSYRLQLHCHND
ncbi:hypothetical protein E2C01_082914 [Portunus trituberculatus]|uniref:Uncharacterized protein n=1 Tax=Portunus trituberculatus TaxID=210409 RepID=A0A5B7IZR1_PORTR|nr:hypothetical protein [Portunus trituberculatus]